MTARAKVVTYGDGRPYGVKFMCPGCGDTHHVPTGSSPNAWGFNNDFERPTLTPSILLHETVTTDGRTLTPRCHSFVTDGRIQFCGDSAHALAGQTVDLPEIT